MEYNDNTSSTSRLLVALLALTFASAISTYTWMNFVFFFAMLGLSIYLFAKYRWQVNKKDIGIGILLALLSIAYEVFFMSNINIFQFALVVLSFWASIGTFRSYLGWDKVLASNKLKSIGLGLLLGVILGLINLKLEVAGTSDYTIRPFILSLNPGIFEEISMRFIIYALAVHIMETEAKKPINICLVYLMMIIPHNLGHGYDLGSFVINFILFGFTMAYLQRKVDLTSAMITHYIIDVIRFLVLGQ